MKKLFQITGQPLEEIQKFIAEGGEVQRHSFMWGYDVFPEFGFEVSTSTNHKKSRLIDFISKKLNIPHLDAQLDCLKRSKEIDIVFVPWAPYGLLLAFLKMLHLYRTPVVAMSQLSMLNRGSTKKQRILESLQRYILFKGLDKIIFMGEKTLEKALQNNVPEKHQNYISWGVDLDFFSNFIEAQTEAPRQDYFLAVGYCNRDYKMLIELFKGLDFDLRIFGDPGRNEKISKKVPPNVYLDEKLKPSITSTGQLRKEYYNALGVVIPLTKQSNSAQGSTVMLEAMAMAKPIIVTDNDHYTIDVEKERIGFKIPLGDADGWRQAMQYLIDHPEEAKEMGQRGLALCQKKYNYSAFSRSLATQLQSYLQEKTVRKTQVAQL